MLVERPNQVNEYLSEGVLGGVFWRNCMLALVRQGHPPSFPHTPLQDTLKWFARITTVPGASLPKICRAPKTVEK